MPPRDDGVVVHFYVCDSHTEVSKHVQLESESKSESDGEDGPHREKEGFSFDAPAAVTSCSFDTDETEPGAVFTFGAAKDQADMGPSTAEPGDTEPQQEEASSRRSSPIKPPATTTECEDWRRYLPRLPTGDGRDVRVAWSPLIEAALEDACDG